MSTKTEELKTLFKEWKENLYTNTDFSQDGINNEELYEELSLNAKPKILFIAKEPNNNHHPEWDNMSSQEWWKENLQGKFSLRIAEWSYGLLYEFCQYDNIDIDMRREAISRIAFMNIKKSKRIDSIYQSNFNKLENGSSSDYGEMLDLIRKQEHKTYIMDEINIIAPEIIITGFGTWPIFSDELFLKSNYNIQWDVKKVYNIRIGKFNSTKVIDFYHPSAYIPPAASYSLLQNIVSTEQFKNL